MLQSQAAARALYATSSNPPSGLLRRPPRAQGKRIKVLQNALPLCVDGHWQCQGV